MASTPGLDPRSPLTILKNLPKEHEKAIKQAFYNTAANIFVLLACAAAIAVYFILESFLKPLLWAVLCGAFLYPFKRTLTSILKSWLTSLRRSETPFVVAIVITPLKCADNTIDYVCNTVYSNVKILVGVLIFSPAAYLLWHFGPLWGIFYVVKETVIYTYDLIGYFHTFWIWTIFAAYFLAIVFFWSDQSRDILRLLSIPLWLMMILHIAATAGILRVPLLMLMGIVMIVGFVAQQNEIRREQEEGRDPNRRSVFDSALNFLIGDQLEDSSGSLADGKDVAATHSDSTETKDKEVETSASASKPTSLPFQSDVQRRIIRRTRLSTQQSDPVVTTKSLSSQYMMGLFYALILTRLWMHAWLVALMLPVPVAIWGIKKLSLKLSSPEGPLGNRVKEYKKDLHGWMMARKDVLMPNWLQGIAGLVSKADQKFILLLESSLDKATSVLFILLLLVGSTVFAIIFAIQVQQESMYLVKTTSNLLNNTLHPEMENWLPKNEDLQQAMDSMVGNAYLYGRNYIAAKVRELVNGPSTDNNNSQIEKQVLEIWDRLYESWLARNQSSTGVAQTKPGLTFEMNNLSSIWNVVTQGDGFNFSGIFGFVKENIGTFVSVLESIWLVLKGNMNLVMTVLTSVMSLVFGGGTALLNFVLSSVIFLTTLFYLLASSGDQYKPIDWFAAMSPTTGGGSTFGQAVQDAVGGVFMASLKMATFYGLYTWLTHTIFGINIVFIPSAVAAVFGAVPFVGTYLAAIPAVIELWLVQDKFVPAMLLLVIHFLPTYVVDTAIYSEIQGGHPYMTGLAIAGGMLWLGLEGAIFGPIILCCLIVLVKVYGSMLRPETPAVFRSSSAI